MLFRVPTIAPREQRLPVSFSSTTATSPQEAEGLCFSVDIAIEDSPLLPRDYPRTGGPLFKPLCTPLPFRRRPCIPRMFVPEIAPAFVNPPPLSPSSLFLGSFKAPILSSVFCKIYLASCSTAPSPATEIDLSREFLQIGAQSCCPRVRAFENNLRSFYRSSQFFCNFFLIILKVSVQLRGKLS